MEREGEERKEQTWMKKLLTGLLGTVNHTPLGDHLTAVGTEAQRGKLLI